ncbi:kinase-like protein [Exidia glandulosa HHB12029]|uniref:Kinase-like protein n=1 Tax=Exidia glandulosa HHB12029 TaxID=1314781 RepID=A0A165C7R4_EXIGL|nr:kinase-like protein [Exidia glandulosa HHB12029]
MDEPGPSSPAPSTTSSSPRLALALVVNQDDHPHAHPWTPILTASHQVVLYNAHSHALAIRSSTPHALPPASPAHMQCPYCGQDMPQQRQTDDRAPDYFKLLAVANETASRPSTPPAHDEGARSPSGSGMAQGYFDAFFRVEQRLGMGASGAVFLVQHVIDGNELGRFAVKRIAVGSSPAYLLDILREVRLLETLRHDNIISYHHAWLESFRWSPFQSPVPTLHILMQWADGGSLDDLIEARLGGPATPGKQQDDEAELSRGARIRLHRARAKQRTEQGRAVHYLSAEEVRSLFLDVASGLAFLHERAILHLDLKPGNVLLTFDDGRIIPRAMLSDFGTSLDSLLPEQRPRTGNTGTLEYAAPESLLPRDHTVTGLAPLDSKADMWSLGMILYKLVFFRLPWKFGQPPTAQVDGQERRLDSGGVQAELEEEIRAYKGFTATPLQKSTLARRGLPRAIVALLESLLHVSPRGRPTCERVLSAVRDASCRVVVLVLMHVFCVDGQGTGTRTR